MMNGAPIVLYALSPDPSAGDRARRPAIAWQPARPARDRRPHAGHGGGASASTRWPTDADRRRPRDRAARPGLWQLGGVPSDLEEGRRRATSCSAERRRGADRPAGTAGRCGAGVLVGARRATAARQRLTVLVTVPDHARSTAAIMARFPQTRPCTSPLRRPAARWRASTPRPSSRSTQLPAGIQAFETSRADERAIWIAPHRALVVGDVLLGTADGGLRVCPDGWLPRRVTRATVAAG